MAQQFKKQSIVMAILFTFLTLGIYVPAWFYGQREAFNALQSKEKLGINWIVCAVILSSIAAVLTLLSFIVSDPQQLKFINDFDRMLSMWGGVIIIFVSLKCCRILNENFNTDMNTNNKFSPVLSFFFGMLYLQYRMNRLEAPVAANAPIKF